MGALSLLAKDLECIILKILVISVYQGICLSNPEQSWNHKDNPHVIYILSGVTLQHQLLEGKDWSVHCHALSNPLQ